MDYSTHLSHSYFMFRPSRRTSLVHPNMWWTVKRIWPTLDSNVLYCQPSQRIVWGVTSIAGYVTFLPIHKSWSTRYVNSGDGVSGYHARNERQPSESWMTKKRQPTARWVANKRQTTARWLANNRQTTVRWVAKNKLQCAEWQTDKLQRAEWQTTDKLQCAQWQTTDKLRPQWETGENYCTLDVEQPYSMNDSPNWESETIYHVFYDEYDKRILELIKYF
jgi:hypothetical protein